MCRLGDRSTVTLMGTEVEVDTCLVPYLLALNDAGIRTSSSCCGHGEGPGHIRTFYSGENRLLEIHPPGVASLNEYAKRHQKRSEETEERRKKLQKPPADKMIRHTENK